MELQLECSLCLERAQDFAAASKTLVSATVSNKGTADITATSGKIVSSDNPPIVEKVFTNSNSPLTSTNFLGDGAVAQYLQVLKRLIF